MLEKWWSVIDKLGVPKYPHNSCRSAYLPYVSHTTTAENELAKNFLPYSSINSPRIITALIINLTKRISSSDTWNIHSCDFVKIIDVIITFTIRSRRVTQGTFLKRNCVNWKTSSTYLNFLTLALCISCAFNTVESSVNFEFSSCSNLTVYTFKFRGAILELLN